MPHILISNDDGIHAPGILALIQVAREFGDVTVVAPDSPQSAMGHAISVVHPCASKRKNSLRARLAMLVPVHRPTA